MHSMVIVDTRDVLNTIIFYGIVKIHANQRVSHCSVEFSPFYTTFQNFLRTDCQEAQHLC